MVEELAPRNTHVPEGELDFSCAEQNESFFLQARVCEMISQTKSQLVEMNYQRIIGRGQLSLTDVIKYILLLAVTETCL